MDRRKFLRKLIKPQALRDRLPLKAEAIPLLSQALRKEPEVLQYRTSDDTTTTIYTYHLEKRQGAHPGGALIVSLELNSNRDAGEINLTEFTPGGSPRRECLSLVTAYSVEEHSVTFYQPGLKASISGDYLLRLIPTAKEP